MSNPLLPPAPYQTPFVDNRGVMTPIWAKWFGQLYLRAGGADAPANSNFASASSVTALQTSVASINASIAVINTTLSSQTLSIASLTSQVDGLSVGRQL